MISEGKDQKIQISMILKNVHYTEKCQPAPWVGFDFKSCRNSWSEHCENAEERKAHVSKIALLWSAFSVFVLLAKVAGLFWKTNEGEQWEIRDV